MISGVHIYLFAKILFNLSKLKPWSNEDESRWELRSESLHESFLNSHAPVKREKELHAWELMRVDWILPGT